MVNWIGMIRQVQKIILDLVYPPLCACCSQSGAWLCWDCVATIEHFPAPRCIKCDRPLSQTSTRTLCQTCEQQPMLYLDGIRTIGPHKDTLREAIHAFKYEKHQNLAFRLGWLLAECWRERAGFQIEGLLPIPLHPNREQERGFNQSERLAHVMSQHLATPLYDDVLIRIRDTTSQVGLSRQDRIKNMGNAFIATPQAADKRWLLVDDVCTTGSTLMACAQALRAQGAHAVWAITLTRPFYDHKNSQWEDKPTSDGVASHQTSVWKLDN